MDAVTAMTLDRGRKNNVLLVQPQYSPMPVEEQVAILYCGTKGLLGSVALEKVPEFQDNFLRILRASYKDTVLAPLKAGKLSDEVEAAIRKVAVDVAGN